MYKYTIECFDFAFFGKDDLITVVVTEITDKTALERAKQIVDRCYYDIIKIEEIRNV